MISKNSIKASLKSLPHPLLAVMRFFVVRPIRAYTRYAPWSKGKLLLYRSIAEHLWWLEGTVTSSTVFGKTLKVDAGDIIGKHIYYFGIWEPNLTHWIECRLQRGDLFIDVGASIGYYSLLASKLVGDSGKVVAIEPLPETFGRLEDNLKKNEVRNVRTINAAAWDKTEKVKIFASQKSLSGTTTLMSEWANQWHLKKQLEVDAAPLSVILKPDEIKTARLIKIDVEGAELHVVSDMVSWLSQTIDKFEIVIELSRSILEAEGKQVGDVLRLFARFGFRGYRIENDYLASTCVANNFRPPRRIYQWPNESVDQIDVIFSRVDAEYLY